MNEINLLELDRQLCFALYKASNGMTRAYKPLLAELDITYPQYLVLLALWEQDAVPIKHLAMRTSMEPAQLTPLLRRLEDKGLSDRRKDPQDERSVTIHLTTSGHDARLVAKKFPEQLACATDLKLEQVQALQAMLVELNLGLERNRD